MKRIHYIVALVVLVIGSYAFISLNGDIMADSAKRGDKVGVDYWLTVDGQQIDTSEGRGVFEFTLGAGEVIPGFDNAVTGMSVGDEKTVELSGSDAYTAGPLAGKKLKFRIVLRNIEG